MAQAVFVLRHRQRLLRFAVVGLCCWLLQLGVFKALESVGLSPSLANAGGFVMSAQLNFVLSCAVTWVDAPCTSSRGRFYRWLSFMSIVSFSLLVNAAAFKVLAFLPTDVARVFGASLVSTCCTFVLNHFVLFRPRKGVLSNV